MMSYGLDDNVWYIFERFSSTFVLEYTMEQLKWKLNGNEWCLAHLRFCICDNSQENIFFSFFSKSTREAVTKHWRVHEDGEKTECFQ